MVLTYLYNFNRIAIMPHQTFHERQAFKTALYYKPLVVADILERHLHLSSCLIALLLVLHPHNLVEDWISALPLHNYLYWLSSQHCNLQLRSYIKLLVSNLTNNWGALHMKHDLVITCRWHPPWSGDLPLHYQIKSCHPGCWEQGEGWGFTIYQ